MLEKRFHAHFRFGLFQEKESLVHEKDRKMQLLSKGTHLTSASKSDRLLKQTTIRGEGGQCVASEHHAGFLYSKMAFLELISNS